MEISIALAGILLATTIYLWGKVGGTVADIKDHLMVMSGTIARLENDIATLRKEFDKIVARNQEDSVAVPKKKRTMWDLPDPKVKSDSKVNTGENI